MSFYELGGHHFGCGVATISWSHSKNRPQKTSACHMNVHLSTWCLTGIPTGSHILPGQAWPRPKWCQSGAQMPPSFLRDVHWNVGAPKPSPPSPPLPPLPTTSSKLQCWGGSCLPYLPATGHSHDWRLKLTYDWAINSFADITDHVAYPCMRDLFLSVSMKMSIDKAHVCAAINSALPQFISTGQKPALIPR